MMESFLRSYYPFLPRGAVCLGGVFGVVGFFERAPPPFFFPPQIRSFPLKYLLSSEQFKHNVKSLSKNNSSFKSNL